MIANARNHSLGYAKAASKFCASKVTCKHKLNLLFGQLCRVMMNTLRSNRDSHAASHTHVFVIFFIGTWQQMRGIAA